MKDKGYKNSTMPVHTRVCDERIAELEAENQKLREALKIVIANYIDNDTILEICEEALEQSDEHTDQ
jgi:hypothetical protein